MLICSTLHIIDKVVIILTHHYGYLLKVLSGYMKASMDNALASMDLTSAQGHIMATSRSVLSRPAPGTLRKPFI